MMVLNGSLVEGDELATSVHGRGFAFGFGIFETIKFLQGRPVFLKEHWTRLQRAKEKAGLRMVWEYHQCVEEVERLLAENGVEDGVFKIVISELGDSAATRVLFVRSAELAPEPKPARLTATNLCKPSTAFSSLYKSLNYMDTLVELSGAKERGFDDVVFRNEKGEVSECAFANLFWTREGKLFTPEVSCGLLDGIVRSKILEVAKSEGISVTIGRFEEKALLEADEVFLTSSGLGPRSADSYCAMDGTVVSYGSYLLEGLKTSYHKLERESVGMP